ncbi:MAG: hypothetical protein WC349_05035 [Patescibacteria group bacterium]|jgi:hypothetical protein
MEIMSLVKEFGTALLADVFSIKMLTKLLAKGTVGQHEGIGANNTAGPTEQIRFGGLFDLSDETAYFSLIAKMQSDTDLVTKKAAVKISKFLNGDNFEDAGQKRRFRAVVGNLSNIDYVKEEIEEKIPGNKPGQPEKTKKKQIKANLGVEFIKSFAVLNKSQMLEVCKASGIMESMIDNIGEDLTRAKEKFSKILESDWFVNEWPKIKEVSTKLTKEGMDKLEEKVKAGQDWVEFQKSGNWFQRHFCPWRLFRGPSKTCAPTTPATTALTTPITTTTT